MVGYVKKSIVHQVLLPSVVLVATLLLCVAVADVVHERRVWRSEVELLSASVATASEWFSNPHELASYVERLGDHAMFDHVVIASGLQPEIIASAISEEVGTPLSELSDQPLAQALTSALKSLDASRTESLLAQGIALRRIDLSLGGGPTADDGWPDVMPSVIGFRVRTSDEHLPLELILVFAGALIASLLSFRLIFRRIFAEQVLSPLSIFANAFEQHGSDPSVRIELGGSLEFDTIARRINSKLDLIDSRDVSIRRLAKVMEKVPEPVVVVTGAGTIVWVNRAFERHSGYSWADVSGKPMPHYLLESSSRDMLVSNLWRELRAGREATINTRFTAGDGSEQSLIARAYPLMTDSGAIESVVIIGLFDPERREIERRAAALVTELQEQVASDLHDQVGGDLGGILLRLRVLLDRLELDRSVHAAEVKKLLTVLGEVSSNTRAISHLLSPAGRNIGSLADALAMLAESTSAAGGATCTSMASEEFDKLPLLTKQQIYLIAQEAARNAVRHADAARAPRIRIRMLRMRGNLVVRVTSYGAPWSTDSVGGGHGLHMMRYRADLIRGAVSVRTRPNGITSVRLTVPLARPAMGQEA